MSLEAEAVVREAMERFSAGDYEGTLDLIAEDAVWEPSGRFVGSSQTYRGHTGIREFWTAFTEPWERFELAPLDLVELNDGLVLTDTVFKGTGRASAVAVEMELTHLWTVHEQKIARFQSFASRSEALEAAGRSE